MISSKRRTPLKLIPQKEEMDCGVACVAMVCGVSYRQAFNAIFPKGIKKDHRTFYPDLKRAITALGGKHAPNAGPAKSAWNRMKCTSIVRVNNKKDGTWHWVVYDAKFCVLLDPVLNAARLVRQPSRKMTSRLKIYHD